MKTIYLVRHGETDHNAAGLVMGQLDIPLNARGGEQARQVCGFLRGYPITRVMSSDLGRSLATARPLGEVLGVPVEPDARLRELGFGAMEGRTLAEYEAEYPEIIARWRGGDFDAVVPGGEARRSLMARTRAVLDEIRNGSHEHVAVFSHGGPLNAIHTHIVEQGNPSPCRHVVRAFRFNNGSASMSAWDGDQWRFLVVNSTFHLTGESRALLY